MTGKWKTSLASVRNVTCFLSGSGYGAGLWYTGKGYRTPGIHCMYIGVELYETSCVHRDGRRVRYWLLAGKMSSRLYLSSISVHYDTRTAVAMV